MALGQKLMNDVNKIITNYDVIALHESKKKSFCCEISSSSEDNISSIFEMSVLLYVYVQDTLIVSCSFAYFLKYFVNNDSF